MLNRYLENPTVPGTCLHNTQHWQVTELMGGLVCELLLKERQVSVEDQRRLNFSLHDCYPQVFMQGDEASSFLQELRQTQAKLTPAQVDALMLDAYRDVVN